MTEDIRLNDRRPSEETHLIRLSVEDQSVVVDAILGPPAPHDALCRAARCVPCPRSDRAARYQKAIG